MQATISRRYREGNLSVYSETVTHYWQEYLQVIDFEFDAQNKEHRDHANEWLQKAYGGFGCQVSYNWETFNS